MTTLSKKYQMEILYKFETSLADHNRLHMKNYIPSGEAVEVAQIVARLLKTVKVNNLN